MAEPEEIVNLENAIEELESESVSIWGGLYKFPQRLTTGLINTGEQYSKDMRRRLDRESTIQSEQLGIIEGQLARYLPVPPTRLPSESMRTAVLKELSRQATASIWYNISLSFDDEKDDNCSINTSRNGILDGKGFGFDSPSTNPVYKLRLNGEKLTAQSG